MTVKDACCNAQSRMGDQCRTATMRRAAHFDYCPVGTTQYGYDDDGRLVRVTDPDGETTSYSYDADGNLQQVMYPNGTLTEYGYDTFNRVVSVENRTVTGIIISSSTYTLGPKGERVRVEEASGRSVDIYIRRTRAVTRRTHHGPGRQGASDQLHLRCGRKSLDKNRRRSNHYLYV
jgi:YD repeat-containing protein